MTAPSDWQPGDPLHTRGTYGNYLFNWRGDTDNDHCYCPDAAEWPNPGHNDLGPGDELEDFIAEVRAHQEAS